jgi:hypothetical protein
MTRKPNPLDVFAAGFASLIISLRWPVILAALAGSVYAATGMGQLEYSNNYRTFFSKENPELKAFEEFQAVFTKNDNILFVLAPRDEARAFDRATLEAVAKITEAGWQAPYARRVDSVTNFQHTRAAGDELIVEDLIADVAALADEELREKESIALAEPLLRNQLVTADGRVTAVNITLNYPELSLSEVPEAVAFARALRDEIEAEHPNLDVLLSGTSMLNNAFSEASVADYKLLVPLMFLIIVATTAMAVRSIAATASVLLVIVLSCLIAMGWAGFSGIRLAGPSPSAPIVILTLAIADSIHILLSTRIAMRAGFTKRAAIIEALRTNFLAVFITSLTTIVGFLTLNFSDSPPFRDLGNITAVGVAAAWLLSITLLPALIAVIPLRVPPIPEEKRGRTLMAGFGDFVVARHRLLLSATTAGAAFLIAQIPTIDLSDRFRTYFGEQIEFRRDTDKVTEHLGFNIMEFAIPAGEAGGVNDPEFLRRVSAFTDWLRAREGVNHVFSITDIMKRLNRNLNGDDPAFYRLPEDRETAAQYLLLFELSLPYGLDLTDRIDIDKSATRVTATLDGDLTTPEIRKFLKDSRAWLEANAPEQATSATGPQVMFTFIAQRNIESMIRGTIISILSIGVIMTLTLRNLKLGLLSLLPNSLPILAGFGVWAVLVGEVGFSIASIASISFGIVVDDTIHFLTKYVRSRRERGLDGPGAIRYAFEEVGLPLLINTVILTAGFLVLAFSQFKILKEMGQLTSLTILLAILFDFFFLPGMLLIADRRRKRKGAPHA